MAKPEIHFDEIERLVGLLIEGALGADDRRRLEATLLSHPAALDYYQDYIDVHCLLHWQQAIPDECHGGNVLLREQGPGFRVQDSDSDANRSPFIAHHSLFSTWLSYAIAMLVMAVGMLAAWQWKATQHPSPIAAKSPSPGKRVAAPQKPTVARVVAEENCRWVNPATGQQDAARGKFELASGKVEIVYDTGAKVALEGPASFRLDAANGGYLGRGKITIRFEKGDAGFGVQGSGAMANASAVPPAAKGALPPPGGRIESPLFHLPAPRFIVRTPTAIVTDRGAEFSVTVDESGASNTYLVRGALELRFPHGCKPQDRLTSATKYWGFIEGRIDTDVRAICVTGPMPAEVYAGFPNGIKVLNGAAGTADGTKWLKQGKGG